MIPLISMMPVIDLSLIDDAYYLFLPYDRGQYILWNTGDKSTPDIADLNEELLLKNVPHNLVCLLKVFK